MRLIPLADAEQVARRAAHHIATRIERHGPSAQRPFVLGLPTGSTPLGTYRELVRLHRAGALSFRHVVTFNMDEYVGLSPSHPQSYHAFMHRHLFSQIDIPADNIHLLNGTAEDLDAECRRFENRIRHYGGVNLFLGGVGSDGHIAFNEPASSLASRTRVMTLTDATRRANARFFNDDPAQVPRRALTVGVGTLMEAEEIMLLVTGAHKARALQAAVEGPVNHLWTVSALQLHPNSLILCDDDATLELRVRTLRYFQQREADMSACPE
ncbi:glucosamine-6-phosphate deaminase [Oceanimonas sp. NS1]|uniref:Glucosamine-6-phosphate deaminase n=1 Tax=Oceanimonas doudoroffii TaxID=84158 RepID=A0A233RF96_9GAMM|nr:MULTISPECIES: glucosamine-6-phosphate deaminase [Oceanimonas]MCT7655807.1 glucosamine-6-phosphate deaminase [Oceanimonas sp. NS1]NHI01558.1 Glucosamine-6-phosphate deaminase [Oceanimonas sp. MB9]OXY82049.1 glucosamine-6-phosphate deaminase [Oceanimonas doudoroffii]